MKGEKIEGEKSQCFQEKYYDKRFQNVHCIFDLDIFYVQIRTPPIYTRRFPPSRCLSGGCSTSKWRGTSAPAGVGGGEVWLNEGLSWCEYR